MAKTTKPYDFGEAFEQELTTYHENILDGLREVTRKSTEDLVNKTRATAPKRTGTFRRYISGDFRGLARGLHTVRVTWYVKAPHYRLTHLLVHGHAKKDGGRVRGDPFLQNALDEVLPEYERAVEEVLKNGQ